MRQTKLCSSHIKLRQLLYEDGQVEPDAPHELSNMLITDALDAGRFLNDRTQLGICHPKFPFRLLLLALLGLHHALSSALGTCGVQNAVKRLFA